MNLKQITLVLTFTLTPQLLAQKPAAPSLATILQSLQANLSHYDQRVSSFFCDEHVESSVDSDAGKTDTVTDSTFRLKRIVEPDDHFTLEESRDIKLINGKPPTSSNPHLEGPAVLNGIFEGGLAVVSASQSSCMKYKLQRTKSNDITIHFATALTPQNTASCLMQEESEGSATIDAATMQVTRIEITTPHHLIIPGNVYEKPVFGKRVLAVDYAPVLLDAETLWLPSTVRMSAIAGANTFHSTIWSFKATYRNFHKLEVTSRMHAAPEVH